MNAAARKKPNRKRGHFVGVWLNEEEHRAALWLSQLAGEPGNLSAGIRYAIRLAGDVRGTDSEAKEPRP